MLLNVAYCISNESSFNMKWFKCNAVISFVCDKINWKHIYTQSEYNYAYDFKKEKIICCLFKLKINESKQWILLMPIYGCMFLKLHFLYLSLFSKYTSKCFASSEFVLFFFLSQMLACTVIGERTNDKTISNNAEIGFLYQNWKQFKNALYIQMCSFAHLNYYIVAGLNRKDI